MMNHWIWVGFPIIFAECPNNFHHQVSQLRWQCPPGFRGWSLAPIFLGIFMGKIPGNYRWLVDYYGLILGITVKMGKSYWVKSHDISKSAHR